MTSQRSATPIIIPSCGRSTHCTFFVDQPPTRMMGNFTARGFVREIKATKKCIHINAWIQIEGYAVRISSNAKTVPKAHVCAFCTHANQRLPGTPPPPALLPTPLYPAVTSARCGTLPNTTLVPNDPKHHTSLRGSLLQNSGHLFDVPTAPTHPLLPPPNPISAPLDLYSQV